VKIGKGTLKGSPKPFPALSGELRQEIKKAQPAGQSSSLILDVELSAEASRWDVTAVSTDDSASYGIIDTSSGKR
jgi:hypothetical protein